jgi:fluoroacetyl-CoA thioesterase
MKPTLIPGIEHTLTFTVPEAKTVPHLYPESPIFTGMPKVFATGFMVGLMEWACCEAMGPHLDEGEGSLGIHIDVSHRAPTPPDVTVRVRARCIDVDGRRITWALQARDEVELIGEGTHQRFVVEWDRFNAQVADKTRKLQT